MESVENPEETIPGNSSRLAGNPNWGTSTVVGIFAGMLYGGSKEASASVSKDAEVMLKMGSTQDKREQHRLMRDAMEKRFTRVTRGSLGYYGVWMIIRCGSLMKSGYDINEWNLCIMILLLIGVVTRGIAFVGMVILQKK